MTNYRLLFVILLLHIGISNAMQQQYTITDMPADVVRNIARFIPPSRFDFTLWKPRGLNALTSTCHYLHACATRENHNVYIESRRNIEQPLKEFLDQVFLCIEHVIARNGNNPIVLNLSFNELAQDMDALSTFFTKCSQPEIVRHITGLLLVSNHLQMLPKEVGLLSNLQKLHIDNNELVSLREIAGLTNLKHLNMCTNKFKKEALASLECIINESLTKLETINISDNRLIRPRDIYQTIARCPLKSIVAYNNCGYRPTPEDIASCKVERIMLY